MTTIGYEIIEDDDGHAPVLEAMSEIAGRLAVTIGAGLVLNEFGGKGLLIGGAPGIPPASMVILGAGTLGCEAAKFARGIGAHVVVLDNDINALRRVQQMTRRRDPDHDRDPGTGSRRPSPSRISWCARWRSTASGRPFW